MAGYCLSLSGCPYVFGSGGVTTLPTSTDADWASDWTLASGFFDPVASNLRWSERMKPLDGDLDLQALTFVLRDQVATSGPAAGYALFTRLATRYPSQLTSTTLGATLSSTEVTTISVASTTGFAGSGVVFVEGEAIGYTGTTAATFTTLTRGKYGSRQVSHGYDPANLLAPEVWAEFPWMARRLAILWRVDEGNVATSIWRGISQRAPRLRGGSGGLYELQCGDAWTSERNLTFVDTNATCKLRGYNSHAFNFSIWYNRAGVGRYDSATTEPLTNIHETLESACLRHETRVRTWIVTDGANTPNHLSIAPRAGRIEYSISSQSQELGIAAGIAAFGAFPVFQNSHETVDPRTATLSIDAPPVAVYASTGAAVYVPVDRVVDFPSSWSSTTTLSPDASAGPYSTVVQPVLMGPYDDGVDLVFVTSGADASQAGITPAGPTITASLRFRVSTQEAANRQPTVGIEGVFRPDGRVDSRNTGAVWLTAATTLTLSVYVRTDHWAYGLQTVLGDTSGIRTGSDPRLWDWSSIDNVANVVDGRNAARELYLGPGDTLGSVFPPLFALHGCGLAVRAGGKLAVVPIRHATSNETPAATLTKADLVDGRMQTYEVWPDGIANVAALECDNVTLNVRDANSVGRYGQARTLKLSASGLPASVNPLQNYRGFSQQILSRVLHLWADPVATVKLPVNLSKLGVVYIGDTIAVSEDLLPDGTGGRGLGNAAALAAMGAAYQYGYVIGREVDIADGVVWLTAILFPAGVAYAPCIRVASSPSTTTVVAATAYVRGTNDYTGGNDAGGGAGYFVAGDVVRFVQRDVTTYTSYGPYTVLSVVGTTVTFTGVLDAALRTSIATAGTIWDLRFDDYGNGSTLQAAQKRWAWVGGASSRVIASSSDQRKTWAP